jgi:murein DD-endopeptidase MepM/ murein hydrolase activator NlpD
MNFLRSILKHWPYIILIAGVTILLLLIYLRYGRQPVDQIADVDVRQPKTLFGIVIDSLEVEHNNIATGESLSGILSKWGVGAESIETLVQKAGQVFDLRRIKAGNTYITFTTPGNSPRLDYLVYEHNLTDYLIFGLKDSLWVQLGQKEIKLDTSRVAGTINSSLWNTLAGKGDDPFLAVEISEVFAWLIDFYAIQKGDSFNVVYERRSIEGEYAGHGRVLAAYFYHMGKDFYGFYFEQDSIGEYFDEKGQSVRREFLKAPLKFSRISSRFSNSRLHPVLRIRRPHHGVDYAAPTGTPVQTIGSGTVIQANYSRGAGKMIKIKHNSSYTTAYLHLSRFGKGIKNGARVNQGDIIGYVGSTGLSTGPHLDFRVYKNGKAIDPLKMESPPALPVRQEHKSHYEEHVKFWKTQFVR